MGTLSRLCSQLGVMLVHQRSYPNAVSRLDGSPAITGTLPGNITYYSPKKPNTVMGSRYQIRKRIYMHHEKDKTTNEDVQLAVAACHMAFPGADLFLVRKSTRIRREKSIDLANWYVLAKDMAREEKET